MTVVGQQVRLTQAAWDERLVPDEVLLMDHRRDMGESVLVVRAVWPGGLCDVAEVPTGQRVVPQAARKFKRWRHSNGYTPYQAAMVLGVTCNMVSNWESGVVPKWRSKEQIEAVTGIPESDWPSERRGQRVAAYPRCVAMHVPVGVAEEAA
ncbi:MAG: hypothetical protein GVY18_07675 [Bacteroidetes bacterium]|jgi:DNA-binding XRE family transcriptional regulator|nr:hypothetical protein [Bacteroidota bacterium]